LSFAACYFVKIAAKSSWQKYKAWWDKLNLNSLCLKAQPSNPVRAGIFLNNKRNFTYKKLYMPLGKILWVDDEIESLQSQILFLQNKGYEVTALTNGFDAVDFVRENQLDVVLLDETMPGITGLETLSKIKEVNSQIPVVMITKNETENLMDDAIGSQPDLATSQQRDRVLVDGPALTCLAEAAHDLGPAEGLGDAVALHDRQHGLLDRGEALAAFRTRPATTDQLTVVGLTRVDHARVGMPAVRTPHRNSPCRRALSTGPRRGANRRQGTPKVSPESGGSRAGAVDEPVDDGAARPQPVDDLHPCNY
jgi:CheY-like chemotaxis protein